MSRMLISRISKVLKKRRSQPSTTLDPLINSSAPMCQINVLDDTIRCLTCGYYKDDLTPAEVEAFSNMHAELNRPSAIYYVEIDYTKLFP